MRLRFWGALLGTWLVGCVPLADQHAQPASPKPAKGLVRSGTPDEVNIAKARALGRQQLFPWAEWSAATFERARIEKRFIVVHGAAEWCHWCHVMEETTYRHPEVGKLLRDRFVVIRVDIDSRPDIEERYEEWGWPATIFLDPEANEVAKYRGYLEPKDMIEILATIDASARLESTPASPPELPPPVEALPWIGASFAQDMDGYYDAAEGGWGMRQKAPVGDNAIFELVRFVRTNERAALERALFSLGKHASLIDPVWGGIYQYSTGSTWDNAHYEKLMTYQAQNLWAYAEAYRLTNKPEMLAHARNIERYLTSFLSSADGAFLVAQDADVGAHDRDATFVDGDVYYKLGDAQRRKLGIPRIDDHVYAEENGLAIAALATLYRATGDEKVRSRATKAADLVLASHVDAEGRVKRDAASGRKVWYLADAAAFGFALALLHEVGGDARFGEAAARIAEFLLRELHDPAGGFWGHTLDPDATGVFATARKPHEGNIHAARLFAALHRATKDPEQLAVARATLAALFLPAALKDRGRMIGAYLVALDEAEALRWPAQSPPG